MNRSCLEQLMFSRPGKDHLIFSRLGKDHLIFSREEKDHSVLSENKHLGTFFYEMTSGRSSFSFFFCIHFVISDMLDFVFFFVPKLSVSASKSSG